jgi:hypothetical protein
MQMEDRDLVVKVMMLVGAGLLIGKGKIGGGVLFNPRIIGTLDETKKKVMLPLAGLPDKFYHDVKERYWTPTEQPLIDLYEESVTGVKIERAEIIPVQFGAGARP